MDDFRADDADVLTPAGMDRMLEWLHNVKPGQVATATDAIMCNLLAYEIEQHRRDLSNERRTDDS